MRRFVQAFAVSSNEAEGSIPMEPVSMEASSEDVAEDVAGGNHVKLFGCAYQLHGCVVHVHMGKLDIRVLFADFLKDFAPQFGGFQKRWLCLLSRLLLRFGRIEGNVGNTADFAFAVFHGVVAAFAFAVFQEHGCRAVRQSKYRRSSSRTMRDVETGYDFRFQSGSVGQLFIQNGRAQVGKQIQVLTDGQQSRVQGAADGRD